MTISLDTLIFYNATLDDAEPTLGLMERCDLHEYGEVDSDIEDLLHDWAQIDLNHDVWLAFTPQGDLVGYAALLPWGADVRYEFYIDPAWEGMGLTEALLAWCERHALAFAARRGKRDEVTIRTFISHRNDHEQQVVTQVDFQLERYFFQMQADLATSYPQPQWPVGVTVRSVIVGKDEQALYELIENAFDRPGRTQATLEEWKTSMMRSDIFEPELWSLAVADEQIVGACLAFHYPSIGWVRQLAVADAWQRKGIATALLHHTFHIFKARDAEKVGLSVESARPNAYAFYQQVGMRVARQYDEYVKVRCVA